MPFGNPEREKSFRCRFTHFFAKASIFSFCVGVFNKNANTKDARKQNRKSFCHLRRTPAQLTFLQKRFLFPSPAARGGKAARDAEKTYMFFSSICFEARHRVKRETIACLQ
ncbi:MAG: hypothetical protein E7605_02780 [Ruminococcaceae bacterium]|nr:hypothetical protein [Oscillospiraceae bacterium]